MDEAQFESKLQELDQVGSAYARAYAYIARLDEDPPVSPPTLGDWLGRRPANQHAAPGYVESQLDLSAPRAAERRLENICARHEQRLEQLFERYNTVTPEQQPTEPSSSQSSAPARPYLESPPRDDYDSDEEWDVPDLRTLIGGGKPLEDRDVGRLLPRQDPLLHFASPDPKRRRLDLSQPGGAC